MKKKAQSHSWHGFTQPEPRVTHGTILRKHHPESLVAHRQNHLIILLFFVSCFFVFCVVSLYCVVFFFQLCILLCVSWAFLLVARYYASTVRCKTLPHRIQLALHSLLGSESRLLVRTSHPARRCCRHPTTRSLCRFCFWTTTSLDFHTAHHANNRPSHAAAERRYPEQTHPETDQT